MKCYLVVVVILLAGCKMPFPEKSQYVRPWIDIYPHYKFSLVEEGRGGGIGEFSQSEKCRIMRWKFILQDLHKVKIGMSWHEVFSIIGPPMGEFSCFPENTVQYMHDAGDWKGEDKLSIILVFTSEGVLRDLRRSEYLYSSPPG